MRVVLDTNVLVSALIIDGNPRKLLKEILTSDAHALILSDPITRELSEVVGDDKIRKYVAEDEYSEFLEVLLSKSEFIQLRSKGNCFIESG